MSTKIEYVKKHKVFFITCAVFLGFLLFFIISVGLPFLVPSTVKVISKILVPLLTGLGTIGAIVIFCLQLLFQTKKDKELLEQIGKRMEQAEKRMATKQFNRAVKNLGSSKQPRVLGGVHTLHHLACNQPDDYAETVFDYLCNFIREETTKQSYREYIKKYIEYMKGKDREGCSPSPPKGSVSRSVIQTIINNLFRNKGKDVYDGLEANLTGAWLSTLDLSRAELKKARLNNAHLEEASLFGAYLKGAFLAGAHLEGAWLLDAYLNEAKLNHAHLEGAILKYARLEVAELKGAYLERAYLNDAYLEGAYLRDARLEGANLNSAYLKGACLDGAHLEGACLSRTVFKYNLVSNACFNGARSPSDYIGTSDCIESAYKENKGLETDLSGVIVLDMNNEPTYPGNDWFRERGAIVDDLPAERVQEIFKKWFEPEQS